MSVTIGIIGIGNVGATTAYTLLLEKLCTTILLYDTNEERCAGHVADISDAESLHGSRVRTGTMSEIAQADIIIITAGKPQVPGQSRQELATTNAAIMRAICSKLKPLNPRALIVVVTNPLDLMTALVQSLVDLPHTQVIGSGTWLDTQRLRKHIAQEVGVNSRSISAMVLGEHGDEQCAVWSHANIVGMPIQEGFLSVRECTALAEATMQEAYTIIAQKEATYFGIAACVADICTACIYDQKRILTISAYVPKYGVYLSMPHVLGSHGVEQTLLLALAKDERSKLKATALRMQKELVGL